MLTIPNLILLAAITWKQLLGWTNFETSLTGQNSSIACSFNSRMRPRHGIVV